MLRLAPQLHPLIGRQSTRGDSVPLVRVCSGEAPAYPQIRVKHSDLDQKRGYGSSGVYDYAVFGHDRNGDGLGHGAPMFHVFLCCLSSQFSQSWNPLPCILHLTWSQLERPHCTSHLRIPALCHVEIVVGIIVSSNILFSILIGTDENASNSHGNDPRTIRDPLRISMDLAEEIKDLHHLLDLISEHGSNGCGNCHFRHATHGLADLSST